MPRPHTLPKGHVVLYCIVTVCWAISFGCLLASRLQVGPNTATTFNYKHYKSGPELLAAHRAWQKAVLEQLLEKGSPHSALRPPVLLIQDLIGGWGNQLPSLVTGLMMAALSGRVLMLRGNMPAANCLDFHWDVNWPQYSRLYANASNCTIGFNMLVRPDLHWCQASASAHIMLYTSDDYELPLLQINPAFAETLRQLFPAGDVFHLAARQLFTPRAAVLQAAALYQDKAAQCVVGMHIRNHKPQLGKVSSQTFYQQFASIAHGLAQHKPGTVFVASDADIFAELASLMPTRHVWWSNLTQSSVGQRLAAAGNPGTDLSAVVDMWLLSQCQEIIVTAGSSFGVVAAALSNTVPVYAVRGPHTNPYHNPWFWKALSSEPFFWKYLKLKPAQNRMLEPSVVEAMRQKHPLAFQFAQAHAA